MGRSTSPVDHSDQPFPSRLATGRLRNSGSHPRPSEAGALWVMSTYHARVADEQEQDLGGAVEELRAQLAWVRDYL
jgi:hypothetical protein